MTAFLVILSGWILCSVILLISLHGLYVLRENAREREEEQTVEEFRQQLEEWDVALFEIPEVGDE